MKYSVIIFIKIYFLYCGTKSRKVNRLREAGFTGIIYEWEVEESRMKTMGVFFIVRYHGGIAG